MKAYKLSKISNSTNEILQERYYADFYMGLDGLDTALTFANCHRVTEDEVFSMNCRHPITRTCGDEDITLRFEEITIIEREDNEDDEW